MSEKYSETRESTDSNTNRSKHSSAKRIRKIESYLRNKGRKKGWHPQEEEHKRGEKSYWGIQNTTSIFTLFFSVIAASAAAYGACIAVKAFHEVQRQANEAKRQADVAVSDQRPWLHLEDAKTEQINYSVNGLSFTTRFIVKNYGHSPATHAYVRTAVILRKFDVLAEEKALCEAYDFQNKAGQIVFTGAPQEFPVTLSFTNDDIAAERRLFESQGSKMVVAWMTLLACVQYDSIYDTLPHHEGHAFDLNPVDITNAKVGDVLSAPMGHFSILTPIIVD